ncbi:MAG: NAD(P)/FAD-dependent oxidoreductase, partial [Gammaproteobacteria bacterium]|nr:NAD(P)/FAD-dependent oxidoreductase [Gammaproteobacteria bacterium]NNM00775.1 NAD(P)/FAD-dependent oxidoreductase [Gammaproteobacteria bacterium]
MTGAERRRVSREELQEALAAADVPVLLMVLTQLTGEARWISPPFLPRREIYFFADESGGLPENLQDEVRASALEALLDYYAGRLDPAPPPSEERFLEMMRVCVGEHVPDEYLAMMLEEMGLRRRDPVWHARPGANAIADFRVLIIGAGMSGLCAAIKLKDAGIPFEIIEKNPRVGGTWYENIYPEVGCDVPNHFYSFSFRPNPDWSAYFSKGAEIEAYFEACAREYGIVDHIRFESSVKSAAFDADRALWEVEIEGPGGGVSRETANVVIAATGQLNRPKIPAIPGRESFRGPAFHTARWPADLDVTGKRVAVIGTGASAMQMARTTAEQAGRLLIFQRSAQWAI